MGLGADVASTDPAVNRLPANFDNLTITSKGFQFLLEDLHVQLWQILMYYVELREVCASFNLSTYLTACRNWNTSQQRFCLCTSH